jgi:hypothetical protein
MFTRTQTRRLCCALTVALFGLLPSSLWAAAPEPVKESPVTVTAIDLDECDPVLIRSRIMEVHLAKGTLVVAEREVREMDLTGGGQQVKTAYLNIAGQPELRAAFRVGQYVMVKGFQHPEGYIAAAAVQKIDKPVDRKMKYKPVEASKKSFRKAAATVRPQ